MRIRVGKRERRVWKEEGNREVCEKERRKERKKRKKGGM